MDEQKTIDLDLFLRNLTIGSIVSMNELKLFTDRFIDNKIIKPKYRFNDEYTLTNAQKSIFKVESMQIGRFILNCFCLPIEYIQVYGPINKVFDAKTNEEFQSNLASLLVENKITADKYSDIIDRISWLGMNMTNFTGKCMDFNSINMSDKFMDMKTKVYKELKAKKASGNDILKAEDKLLELAIQEKNGSGLLEIIKSGAKGSLTNNYKVINIGRGITKNGSNELVLLDKSLVEGNKTSDYVQLSNNNIQGTYGRSMKTAQGGNI